MFVLSHITHKTTFNNYIIIIICRDIKLQSGRNVTSYKRIAKP